MKENKVLSAIYGIALFVAFIGAIGLLYSAIELLEYTSFGYDSSYGGAVINNIYYKLQQPIAIALLVSAIFAIVGVVGGLGYVFSKTRKFKIIYLSCAATAVLSILAALITVLVIWRGGNYGSEFEGTILIYKQNDVACLALYSAAMSSVIQNLACFTVVAALTAYDFFKTIIEKIKNKKNNESENSSVEELQESLEISEKE